MTIGKREQIVTGSIIAIVLIALLHLLIFNPKNQDYKQKKSEFDQTVNKFKGLKRIGSGLDEYNKTTQAFLGDLNSGLERLQLQQPEAFVIPDAGQIKVDVPPGTSVEDIGKAQQKELDEVIKPELFEKQTDLVSEEIERLRSFLNLDDMKASFLGKKGWNIPNQLPEAMQTGQLWDLVRVIAETKGILKRLDQNSQAYYTQRRQYEQYLRQLGLDVQVAKNLRQYGEFVPVFYRMSIANLVMQQIPEGEVQIVLQEPLSRKMLYDILEVDMPYDQVAGLKDNKLYFAYEELRNLNTLLEMAREYSVSDVTEVVFRGYALLRQQEKLDEPDTKNVLSPDELAMTDDEVDRIVLTEEEQKAAAKAGGAMGMMGMPGMGMPGMGMPGMGMPGMPGAEGGEGAPGMPGMMPGMGMPGMGMPGMNFAAGGAGRGGVKGAVDEGEANKPKDNEIGYALPIKLTYRVSNIKGWEFIYEVLRRNPLAELHRVLIRSMSVYDPANTDIEMTSTFLFVPKLFDTLDQVRKMLTEIKLDEPQGKGQDGQQPTAPMPGQDQGQAEPNEEAAATPAGAPPMPGVPPMPGQN